MCDKHGDFVHLHTHTHSSGYDGYGTEDEFVRRVAEMGQKHVAFTEHGTVRGLVQAQEAADKHGVNLIPGIEAYLCDNINLRGLSKEERVSIKSGYDCPDAAKAAVKKAERERRDRDHITIWAMNDEGVKNLYKVATAAWNEGYYYKPRVDLTTISRHNEGLAVSTGCPAGVIPKALREKDYDEVYSRMEMLKGTFGDRFYTEIMPHVIDDHVTLQKELMAVSDEYDMPILATQDAHYRCKSDALNQEVLLCVHNGEYIDDPDRFSQRGFAEHEFYLKTRDEMVEAYRKNVPFIKRRLIDKMCDETVAFAKRCTGRVQFAEPGAYLVAPKLPTEHEDYDSWLIGLVEEGYYKRYGVELEEAPRVHVSRILKELDVLCANGFTRYFAMVYDIVRFCHSSGIYVGPGRGSAAGSMVSYLLGITDLDPIKYDLSFERFIAPGRADLPDIDIDFQHNRRQEVIQYMRDVYGEDHVAFISTSIKFGGRSALRDIGRIFSIPFEDIGKVAALVVDEQSEELRNEKQIKVALTRTKAGQDFAKKYPEAAEAAIGLEGQLKTVGVHAAAVVVTPMPTVEVVPLESRKTRDGKGRVPCIAFDMEYIERMGLVKFDALGLKTCTIIADAYAGSGTNKEMVQYDEEDVLDAFTKNKFFGIFQYDSPSSRKLCKGFEFTSFSQVADITALNRPGPAKTGIADKYMKRAMGLEEVEPVHPIYDRVMSATYGVMVYQEQIVALAAELANYNPVEANAFRKKVAKKKGLSDEEGKFVTGAVANGMDPSQATKLFQSIIGFGSYAFNRSHAFVYAALAWQMMWLKVRHPHHFYSATLTHRSKDEEKLRVASEAKLEGCPLVAPNVNLSDVYFGVHERDDGVMEITGALTSVKGVGESAANDIVSAQPFADLSDLWLRTRHEERSHFTGGAFKALAKANALRDFCPNHHFMVANAETIWKKLDKWDFEFDEVAVNYKMERYTEDESIVEAAKVYPLFENEEGRSKYDAAHRYVFENWDRAVIHPEDAPEWAPDGVLMLGYLNDAKTYPGERGKGKSARLSITSPFGCEVVARADQDVLDRYPVATSHRKRAKMILALLTVREAWGAREGVSFKVAAAWTYDDAVELAGTGEDPVLDWVIGENNVKPRDPASKARQNVSGKPVTIEGMVVSARQHKTKRGEMMLFCAVAGSASHLEFMVFPKRYADPDAKRLEVGTKVKVTLDQTEDGAFCLSERRKVKIV